MNLIAGLVLIALLTLLFSVIWEAWQEIPNYSVTAVDRQNRLTGGQFEFKEDATKFYNRLILKGKYTTVDLWEGDQLIVSWSK